MAITSRELSALVQLVNRTPVSGAEQLWLQGLLQRLASEIELEKAKNLEKAKDEEGAPD